MPHINFECSIGFANVAQVNAATTTEIGDIDCNIIEVVGPGVNISSFGNTPGQLRFVTFLSESNLVHSSALRLSGNTDRALSNGDYSVFISNANGDFSEFVSKKASGTVLATSPYLRSNSYSANGTWTKGARTRWIEVKAWGPGSNRGTTQNTVFGSYLHAACGDDGGGAANGDVNVPFGGMNGNGSFSNSSIYNTYLEGNSLYIDANSFMWPISGGYSERMIDVSAVTNVTFTVVGGRILVREYS